MPSVFVLGAVVALLRIEIEISILVEVTQLDWIGVGFQFGMLITWEICIRTSDTIIAHSGCGIVSIETMIHVAGVAADVATEV